AERIGQFAKTVAAHRRDLEDAITAGLELGSDQVGQIAALGHVDLVERDELRPLDEGQLALRYRIRGKFAKDDVEVANGVTARVERRAVQHVEQRAAALDVAQEFEAEALALAGSLDEAWD